MADDPTRPDGDVTQYGPVLVPRPVPSPASWLAVYPDRAPGADPPTPAPYVAFAPPPTIPTHAEAVYPDWLPAPDPLPVTPAWVPFTPAAATVDLWAGVYPDWVEEPVAILGAAAIGPLEEAVVTDAAGLAPFSEIVWPEPPPPPDLFAPPFQPPVVAVDLWAGVYPAQIDRLPTPTGPFLFWTPQTIVVVVPDLAWQGTWPDLFLTAETHPSTMPVWFGPVAPPVTPDLAWAPTYPPWIDRREPHPSAAPYLAAGFLPPPAPTGWQGVYADLVETPLWPMGPATTAVFGATITPTGLLFRRTLQMRIGGRTVPTKL